MARTVDEIMNRELLAIRPDLPISDVRGLFRSFGVGAAPVVDEAHRPLGVLSVRDLLEGEGTARERMTSPAISVTASTPVEEAARRLANTEMHHLVVVDGSGAATGMLSTLDLLRAVLGMPARHPSAFPHWDATTDTSWTDDRAFDDENLARLPDSPGVLVLVRGGSPGQKDEIVWAEACINLRTRVSELNELPMHQEPALTRVMELPSLRFRIASARDEQACARIVMLLRDRMAHVPPPGGN